MSLIDHVISGRDNFKAKETLYGYDFPCNVCKYSHFSDAQEPCRTCDHNLNAVKTDNNN